MGQLCKLTGVEIPAEGFEPVFKKMCLNCISCEENQDGTFSCKHEKVIDAGRKKILAAVPEGYEIETRTLKPMLLKNPTKKCANYSANLVLVKVEIEKYFV